MKLHKIIFFVFLFLLPFQTRILYSAESAYVSWYFNYHLAIFVYLTDLVLLVCFTHWLVFDTPKWREFRQNNLLILVFALFILGFLSLFHPPASPFDYALNEAWRAGVKHIELGLYNLIKLGQILLILLYIYMTFRERKDFVLTLGLVAVSGIFQALLGWWQFHVQHMIGLRFLGEYIGSIGTPGISNIQTEAGRIIRAYGTLPHPNVLGAFLILGLASALGFISRLSADLSDVALAKSEALAKADETKLRTIYILGLFTIFLGLFASFSRIAWLAAAIIIAAFFAFYAIKKQWQNIFIIAVTVIVSCATIIFLYEPQLQSRISASDPVSVTDRYYFNALGLKLIQDNLLFGVGIGNYVPALQERFVLEPWQYQPAHNIFIQIGAELGIAGLILFFAILFVILRSQRNAPFNQLSFTFYLIAFTFLLMSLFDHYFVTIQQGRLMFAVVLGLIAALPNLEKNPNDQDPVPNQ